jgi:hypothetical protein
MFAMLACGSVTPRFPKISRYASRRGNHHDCTIEGKTDIAQLLPFYKPAEEERFSFIKKPHPALWDDASAGKIFPADEKAYGSEIPDCD